MAKTIAIAPGKVAFVFPGQGSQKVGMGKDAFDASAEARAVYQEADTALGEGLSKLCFEGPESELVLTRNTQPAILATSIALYRLLGERPDVAAGHSLGEYSAHVAAGSLALDAAVRLVRARGDAMQAAVPAGAGAMAAVLKLERAALEEICRSTPGIVEPVNYNSPGQIVIAGEALAVAAASERIAAAGGRAIPLPVSAPFHSSMMKPAEAAFRPHLDAVSMNAPVWPIYCNVDAAPVTTADAARDALARQVARSVRWDESVLAMVEAGVTLFVEIGTGTALAGMIKRTTEKAVCVGVQAPRDVEPAREAIRAARA